MSGSQVLTINKLLPQLRANVKFPNKETEMTDQKIRQLNRHSEGN